MRARSPRSGRLPGAGNSFQESRAVTGPDGCEALGRVAECDVVPVEHSGEVRQTARPLPQDVLGTEVAVHHGPGEAGKTGECGGFPLGPEASAAGPERELFPAHVPCEPPAALPSAERRARQYEAGTSAQELAGRPASSRASPTWPLSSSPPMSSVRRPRNSASGATRSGAARACNA